MSRERIEVSRKLAGAGVVARAMDPTPLLIRTHARSCHRQNSISSSFALNGFPSRLGMCRTLHRPTN
jgi:hypothetical protein